MTTRPDRRQNWLSDKLKAESTVRIAFADLLTRELIDQSENDSLRQFEKHLPASR